MSGPTHQATGPLSVIAGIGLGGLTRKLAEQGVDWPTLIAGLAAFTAFLHALMQFGTATSREIRDWRYGLRAARSAAISAEENRSFRYDEKQSHPLPSQDPGAPSGPV